MSTDLRNGSHDGNGNGEALAAVAPPVLAGELQRLRTENAQLTQALESRIVIEQAKGVLRERYGLSMDASFELLRRAARSNRMNIHALAAKVVSGPATPIEFGRLVPARSYRPAH